MFPLHPCLVKCCGDTLVSSRGQNIGSIHLLLSPQLVAIMKHVFGSFRLLVAGLNHRCPSMSYALPVKPNLNTNNARVHKIKCKGPVWTTQMLHIVISCFHNIVRENQSKKNNNAESWPYSLTHAQRHPDASKNYSLTFINMHKIQSCETFCLALMTLWGFGNQYFQFKIALNMWSYQGWYLTLNFKV